MTFQPIGLAANRVVAELEDKLMARRHPIAVNPTVPRQISTTVPPDIHDAFDKIAEQRNTGKGPLLRDVVEAIVREPAVLAGLLAPGNQGKET